jgi:REP element-mobilizing transposase RayT
LGEASQRLNFDVLAYVVMPEHFHFLIAPRGEFAISAILRDIKQPSAMKMLAHIKLTRPALAEQIAVMKVGRRVGRL